KLADHNRYQISYRSNGGHYVTLTRVANQGAPPPPNPAEQFVAALYRTVLGRAADEAGGPPWGALLGGRRAAPQGCPGFRAAVRAPRPAGGPVRRHLPAPRRRRRRPGPLGRRAASRGQRGRRGLRLPDLGGVPPGPRHDQRLPVRAVRRRARPRPRPRRP